MTSEERSEHQVVLVTGGCGYLGSQLVRDLADRLPGETRIRILDNLDSGRLEAIQFLPPGRFEFLEGDILDPAAIRRALPGVGAVIHLAAIVRTPFGFQNPASLEQVNHWGTAQLVEACLASGVPRLLLASSAAVYGPGEGLAESAPRRPLGPYAKSKVGAEKVVEAASGRGLSTTIIRLGSLFGLAPVTRFEALANRFAYLASVGRSLPVYGNGEQQRPMVHVRDASDFMIRVLVEELQGVWNLAATNSSVNEIVAALQTIRGGVQVHHTDTDHLTHLSLAVETTQAERVGWRPGVSRREGLGEVVASLAGIGDPTISRPATEQYPPRLNGPPQESG